MHGIGIYVIKPMRHPLSLAYFGLFSLKTKFVLPFTLLVLNFIMYRDCVGCWAVACVTDNCKICADCSIV